MALMICRILTALAVSLAAVPSAHGVIYSSGHGDLGVSYGDEWFVHYRLDAGSVADGVPLVSELQSLPEDVIVIVPQSSGITVGSSIPFLGNAPGSTVWVLSQNQVVNEPFLGLSTEELTPSEWTGQIQFRVIDFSGPGNFALWATDSFGSPLVRWRTNDGLSGADVVNLNAGTHAHFNWGFTVPGTYDVGVRVSGTHTTDGAQSAEHTMTFHVVPEPASGLFLASASGCLAFLRRRKTTSNV